MGLKGYNIGEGEIVEVQGGHIIRATGRKDRHSKVFTSKGPRDRRVRLSALTAIQFYDVQDRLGYDRPSKAVDWLIMKAKSAIDKLEVTETSNFQEPESTTKPGSSTSDHNQTQLVATAADIDHEDVMKTFFPATSCSNLNFQNYPYHDDGDNIVSRTATTTAPKLSQDLGLSLHSFQETNNTTPFDTYGRISGWNHQDLAMTTMLSQQQQQRGTLQSSLFPYSFRSWDHQTTPDHHHHHQASSVMLASSAQFGSHGMMMMQGLNFVNPEATTQPNSSSSSPPNSHL